MLAYSCAEGVLENADRILGKHIAKTGMDYVNNALRGTLENPERTPEKTGSGVWIGIFSRLPIRFRSAFFAHIGGRSDPNIGSGQV